jgi:SAM-dependent methyltransferase
MVHALKEIHRVLAPGGILIDLRPFADSSPVEVASDSQTHLAGHLDQLPEDIANDEAANQAIAKAAEQGRLTLERMEFFQFSYEWDSPEEMQAYIEDEWSDFVTIPEDLWRNVRSLWVAAEGGGHLRVRRKMLIARWRVVKDNVNQQFN